ncbi:general stress protein [Gloeobacter kilaueensis]|uniref:General stress protein 17M-like domain-containing protein n=1 Tax=Gloeobacter kilaueensis (strain ATCC BAA-2537 / CCAP 1431/1 / ULC 316 / JS1) TaxID=1183438 RepID=U5QE10_GLOK1|nr:general stress protein [Gloeobacter kilaueensis]AGY57108.1 hypothetical protein GKIL_0862 [Gloeobacter kilaueensis JS1]
MEQQSYGSAQWTPEIFQRGIVAGLFEDRQQAEQAVVDLDANGFNLDNLGIAVADRQQQRDLINATGTQSVEEVAQGGTGLLGTLVNLVRPREPLSGNDLVAVLIGMGLTEEEARHFEQGVERGAILVTVQARGLRTSEAISILRRHGADLALPGPDGQLPLDPGNPADDTGLDLAGG